MELDNTKPIEEINPIEDSNEVKTDVLTDQKEKLRERWRRNKRAQYERKKAQKKEMQDGSHPLQEEDQHPEEVTVEIDNSDDFDQLIEEVTEEKETVKPSSDSYHPAVTQNKVYISGAMFVFCIDFIVPNFIAYSYQFFSKGMTIDPQDLKLEKVEKDEVIPLANEVVKEVFSNASPMSQFLFYMGIMYMGKMTFAEKKPKKQKR